MPTDHVNLLHSVGVRGAHGLSATEIVEIEARYGFVFPDDLRTLLQQMMPQGLNWPDWRRGVAERRNYEGKVFEIPLEEVLARPLDGIIFDVEENAFWLEEWGARPTELDEARRVAHTHIEAAPRLVPVYAHRYIASDPRDAGNPVFSVSQTDIIVYGRDLASYFSVEFGDWRQELTEPARRIPFWTRLVEVNNS